MREVHLINLIEMYSIIMTSFNKIKFKYLIPVWEDVMKIIRNMNKCYVEKILWWRHHLNIPPSPYFTISISHHFRVPPSPPLLQWRPFFEGPLSGFGWHMALGVKLFSSPDLWLINKNKNGSLKTKLSRGILVQPSPSNSYIWS